MVRLRERGGRRATPIPPPGFPHPAAAAGPIPPPAPSRRRPNLGFGRAARLRDAEDGAAPAGAAQPWSEEGESTEGEGGERDLPGRRRRRFPGKETRRAARLLLFREEETFRERALAPIPRVSQPPGSETFGPSGHLRGVAQGIAARFRAQIP